MKIFPLLLSLVFLCCAENQFFLKGADISESQTSSISEKSSASPILIKKRPDLYKVDKYAIGCLLPLSGPHAEEGNRVLRGVQLRLHFFQQNPSPYHLVIVDTNQPFYQDYPERAVRDLVIKEGVMAIIGPLSSQRFQFVAKEAAKFQVPLFPLTSDREGQGEEGIFYMGLPMELQIKALVDYAYNVRQLRKFAILYPETKRGLSFANAFWEELSAQGGEVLAIAEYAPKQMDFDIEVKNIVGLLDLIERRDEYRLSKENLYLQLGRSPREEEIKLPPVIDFDAIFIPDGVKAIGQIAPTLKIHDVQVPLLGLNEWNDAELLKRGRGYVDGAIFADAFSPSLKSDVTKRFLTAYENTYRLTPSWWDAQGYDVASLLLETVLLDKVKDRPSFQETLRNKKIFEGVTGKIQFSNNKTSQRQVLILSIENGSVVVKSIYIPTS